MPAERRMQTRPVDAVHGDLLGILPCEPRSAKRPAAVSLVNCEVAVIWDVDEGVIGGPMKTAEQNQGKAPKYVKDLRQVMG